jgi:hypothetical protein
MRIVLQLLGGMLACGLLIWLARLMRPENELRLYALSLVVAALMYVGFTARGATLRWMALEVTGLVVFTSLALLGLKVSASLLALGWALHAAWDVALHKLLDAGFVPGWYPLVCVGFDLLLAGYLALRFKKNALQRTA